LCGADGHSNYGNVFRPSSRSSTEPTLTTLLIMGDAVNYRDPGLEMHAFHEP
jgi:hypothetical protein